MVDGDELNVGERHGVHAQPLDHRADASLGAHFIGGARYHREEAEQVRVGRTLDDVDLGHAVVAKRAREFEADRHVGRDGFALVGEALARYTLRSAEPSEKYSLSASSAESTV